MRELIEPWKLSDAIKEYCKKHKMNLEEMAGKLGIPRFTLSRWEKQLVRISPMMYKHLKRERVII